MSNKHIPGVLIATFSLLITPVVQAHSLIAEEASWFAGFMHPLLGLDHLLAMLAVGLWAAQPGGNRLWHRLYACHCCLTWIGGCTGSARPKHTERKDIAHGRHRHRFNGSLVMDLSFQINRVSQINISNGD